MPSPVPYGKDICNYCLQAVGRDNLQACSRCRFVRYCSKTCQKAAWPTHKKVCESGADLRAATTNDKDLHLSNERLSKWINMWKISLNKWAIWALNPNASEKDKFSTHCFVLILDERQNPPSPAQLFRLSEVAVLPRARVQQLLKDRDVAQQHIDGWLQDQRGDNTGQLVIFAPGLIRFLWFSIRDIDERQKKELDDTGRMLMDGVPAALQKAVEVGNVSAHDEYLFSILLAAHAQNL